ncbi:MAG: sulfite exporter TauE/SafE family protein [Pseudodesulfovibrio sp.]|nr:sulfite exporter TauE/SafE family protein [Pseudodesulfovibrio sp.]
MDSLFLVALQSSLFLGLIHGVNPCGHSWVILAPFVAGDKSGKRVFSLTAAFITGTTLGCLAIGLFLGTVSASLPESTRYIIDILTAAIIILLGIILIWKPQMLHSHDHHACNCAGPDHHDEKHCDSHHHAPISAKRSTIWGFATLGFVNMIVPCPTVAIMYSYALDSGNAFSAVSVFASYALGTAIALAGVIFAIHKVTGLIRKLQSPWIEPAIMRTVGVMTLLFGVYTLYLDFAVTT